MEIIETSLGALVMGMATVTMPYHMPTTTTITTTTTTGRPLVLPNIPRSSENMVTNGTGTTVIRIMSDTEQVGNHVDNPLRDLGSEKGGKGQG